MKIIADVMLGRLAKYLRIAGNDVLYKNDISDEKLVEIAKNEDRVLLTRDRLILERRDCKNNIVRWLFIKDDMLDRQLKQVKDELDIDICPELKRCIECNLLLSEVNKEDVKGKVPPYVYKTQKHFLFCSRCGKYYWRGTHCKNIEKFFKTLT